MFTTKESNIKTYFANWEVMSLWRNVIFITLSVSVTLGWEPKVEPYDGILMLDPKVGP